MAKIIVINANNNSCTEDATLTKLIDELLEKEFKIIIVNTEYNFISKNNISFKNLANLIEINITPTSECIPASSMNLMCNYGVNFNYPSTIIDCIKNIFSYESMFEYTYITFEDNYINKYTPLINDFFRKNKILPKIVTDTQSLEKELKNILNKPNDNFYRIFQEIVLPEFPEYEEILFSDRSGTLEGASLFFDYLAPFEQNMDELIKLLKNDKFLLCGISSGDHQEGFLSKNIVRRLRESEISANNILAFDQYRMAKMLENNKPKQSNKIIMGFGESTKEDCIKQFLKLLEQSKKLPKKMYACGDHPFDDIPMLKLIHSQGGTVGFISPYTDKDKIIKAIGDVWLNYRWKTEQYESYEYEYEISKTKKYYQMIQNIDENWDWIKPNIYEEAKTFFKKIN